MVLVWLAFFIVPYEAGPQTSSWASTLRASCLNLCLGLPRRRDFSEIRPRFSAGLHRLFAAGDSSDARWRRRVAYGRRTGHRARLCSRQHRACLYRWAEKYFNSEHLAKPPIKRLEDLRSKKVGVTGSGPRPIILPLRLSAKSAWKRDDYTMIQTGGAPEMLAAL